MRILIIEDDPLFAEILQTFLESKDCNTMVSNDIASAKLHLSSSRFDFVLLDNHLPDGNGIHVISYIKKLDHSTPVMMITAEDNQIIMADAFDKGADDFLVKPISVDLLWKKIERCRLLYDREESLKRQQVKLERLIDQQQQEEQLARYVYEHVTSKDHENLQNIDTYLQSSSSFNGDVLVCETAPNGNRFVILADATGHGLAAAISILPLVTTLRAMIRKGLSLAHILHETNNKLTRELPDDRFVAMIGIEVNFHLQQLQMFNGGMPDIICIQADKSQIRFSSQSMALGILEPEDFDPGLVTIQSDEIRNLIFFSDGLIEQPSISGELFGMERLSEIIEKQDQTSKEPLLSRIINEFSVFIGMQELIDDLSICNIQVDQLMDEHLNEQNRKSNLVNGKVTAYINFEGSLLSKADMIGCMNSLMTSVDMVGDLKQKAFTVFSELISNGFDHGILGLDSALKNDFAGFAEYIEEKEEKMASISDDAQLGMKFVYTPSDHTINFEISDSGKGYDFTVLNEMDDEKLSGRGTVIINELCSDVKVIAPGNKTNVTLKRDY